MCVTGAPDEPDVYKESRAPGLSIALGAQGNAAPTLSKAGESDAGYPSWETAILLAAPSASICSPHGLSPEPLFPFSRVSSDL